MHAGVQRDAWAVLSPVVNWWRWQWADLPTGFAGAFVAMQNRHSRVHRFQSCQTIGNRIADYTGIFMNRFFFFEWWCIFPHKICEPNQHKRANRWMGPLFSPKHSRFSRCSRIMSALTRGTKYGTHHHNHTFRKVMMVDAISSVSAATFFLSLSPTPYIAFPFHGPSTPQVHNGMVNGAYWRCHRQWKKTATATTIMICGVRCNSKIVCCTWAICHEI